MTREQLFSIWAPAESIWTPWAKAVVFAHWDPAAWSMLPAAQMDAADALWVPPPGPMAVVVDLPGAIGVVYGLKLAQRGYRPVPLYNAAPWPRPRLTPDALPTELVDVRSILVALARGADALSEIPLPPDAPPAFLLDASRRTGFRRPGPGDFDNRSISLPTDFPSATMLARHGIGRALLIQSTGRQPQADLAHTLGRWGGGGIELLSRPLDGAGEPMAIRVKPPGAVRRFFHGLFAAAGLRRNSLGGFGGFVSAGG